MARSKSQVEVANTETKEVSEAMTELTVVEETKEEQVTGSKLGRLLHKAGNYLDDRKAQKELQKAEESEEDSKKGKLVKKVLIGTGVAAGGLLLAKWAFSGKDDIEEDEVDDDSYDEDDEDYIDLDEDDVTEVEVETEEVEEV